MACGRSWSCRARASTIPTVVPVDEDHPQRPLGAYGRSKIDLRRANAVLGWQPRHDNIRMMMCDAYNRYVENLIAARPRRGLALRLLDALP